MDNVDSEPSKKSRKKRVNNVYRSLISSLLLYLKIPSILTPNESDSLVELESIECDLSEHTIVNRCFKKTSCIQKAAPLTHESIKQSIMREMIKASGRLNMLSDISNDAVDEVGWREELCRASEQELNITLLWSAYSKKWKLLEVLMEFGANIRYSEPTHGLTALHLAAFSGCADGTRLLAAQKINVNTINKWYSPLHCAALAKQAETAEILLNYGARLDSMTNGPGYETPLYIAVSVNALECVRLFVKRGAQISQEGKLADMSPLFLAAELGHTECLKVILDSKSVNCNLMRKSESGNTALHLAAEQGRSDCIEVLLDYGTDPNVTNLRSQTPLHLAVKANSYTSVVLLLKNDRTNINLEDINKRTALHEAIELVADSRRDIVKVLLENGIDVNSTDQHGLTPLHLAALNGLPQSVGLLIDHGADYSIKSKSGMSAFALIAKKTPRILHRIKEKFNEYIYLEQNSESLNKVEMRMDFRNGLHHPREYELFNTFIEAGYKEMLLHPFCRAFLYVTWGRVRSCYYGIICNTLLYSLVLLMYVLTALAYDCDRHTNDPLMVDGSVHCTNESYLNKLLKYNPLAFEKQWYLLLCVTFPIVYRKLHGLHAYPSLKVYFCELRNICDWHCIIYVFLISNVYTGKVEKWQVFIGGFAIVCGWSNTMNLLGQLPFFGPYVEMFHKVMSEFFKLFLLYFLLLFGFSITFCLFFPNSSAFSNPIIGILSTLVLMTGDMNYNILLDYTKEESTDTLEESAALIIYTMFGFFITIILMNLLMGTAIQDIEALQITANLTRLVRQAEVSSYIEIASQNNGYLVKSIMKFFKIYPKPYIGVLTCRPLDSTEEKLPKAILRDAYDLAKKRRRDMEEELCPPRSVGGPWKKLLNRNVQEKDGELKRSVLLKQLVFKVERYWDQVNMLRNEINELKEMALESRHKAF